MKKARSDLRSARVLLDADPPETGTACFHCQQAAEKALKAYLVSQATSFEKVHNLGYLLDLCSDQEEDFTRFADTADTLTPFAVAYRYPGLHPDPGLKEARDAADAAQNVVDYVVDRVPDAAQPG